MNEAQRLYNEATEIYGQIKSILDLESVNAEQEAKLDTLFAAFDAKTAEAKKAEQRNEKAAELRARMEGMAEPSNRLGTPRQSTQADANAETRAYNAYVKAISNGTRSLSAAELKDLSATTDAEGGYLVAPASVLNQFIKFVDDEVAIRRLATVWPLDVGTELVAPSWDVDPSDADWTAEVQSISRDTAARTGQRSLKPNMLAKELLISRRLINQSRINIEQVIRDRLAYKTAIAEEKAFMTGNGAQQPLGLFTASAQGITTSRDTTASATTSFTADNLMDTKHSLKAAYWGRPNTRWIMHRDTVARIRKLKDGNGNYLWSPGLGPGGGVSSGLPATIVDVPYVVSEYAPNTFTTAQYVALIGDLSYYWIADAMRLEIQVLYELYAKTSQVGYISRAECDGMPVLAEAFARLKLA